MIYKNRVVLMEKILEELIIIAAQQIGLLLCFYIH